MKIAIIGTHGIGKSTLATKFVLYALNSAINVKLVREVARDCPLGINEKFNVDSATWIVCEQIKRELDATAKGYPLIICDRSSIDPIMYSRVKFYSDRLGALTSLASSWFLSYDKIIWLRPSGTAIRSDGVRSTDETFQKNIDEAFESYMNDFKPKAIGGELIPLYSDTVFGKDLELFFKQLWGSK
jgi:nicotinamide riboside kinase